MSRSRTSAKQAGTKFETLVAGYLNAHVDDRIERRATEWTEVEAPTVRSGGRICCAARQPRNQDALPTQEGNPS